MASYLQIENISKSYGHKTLFQNIAFNINEGDKIALIAPNGTGKTSLLKILAGKDKSDSGGKITFLKDIRIAFLEQNYDYQPDFSIFEQIKYNSSDFCATLNNEQLYEFELRIKKFLSALGFKDFTTKMKHLSGGEVKRVALSQMFAYDADFYIMDEPTNHLDLDAIEYLENYLSKARSTLLMVSHDRYFIDKVCNTIMEMDMSNIYTYQGNYSNFLEKREERISHYNAETDKVRNLLRRELEWMRSTPCARTGKAKYRKDAFYSLKDRAEQSYKSEQIDMSKIANSSRLGNKIINCKNLSFYYGEECYLKDFTYKFQRYERLGIVGKNGVGKSTFINILSNNINPNGTLSGEIERGESLNIAYYNQNGMEFDENQTILETINDTALLKQFLFGHSMLNNKISTLSGGEKRRLYLLSILSKQANMLILDEPTNDLDIVTLNILEEYLSNYKGSLIIISHDRHFLDRLVDHLFIFCGEGEIKDFIGTYSEYRDFIKDYEQKEKQNIKKEVQNWREKTNSKKLSFKEKRELDTLNTEIAELSTKKDNLLSSMNIEQDFEKLDALAKEYSAIKEELDEKELRWLELSDIES